MAPQVKERLAREEAAKPAQAQHWRWCRLNPGLDQFGWVRSDRQLGPGACMNHRPRQRRRHRIRAPHPTAVLVPLRRNGPFMTVVRGAQACAAPSAPRRGAAARCRTACEGCTWGASRSRSSRPRRRRRGWRRFWWRPWCGRPLRAPNPPRSLCAGTFGWDSLPLCGVWGLGTACEEPRSGADAVQPRGAGGGARRAHAPGAGAAPLAARDAPLVAVRGAFPCFAAVRSD
jgi:hypothetical protein